MRIFPSYRNSSSLQWQSLPPSSFRPPTTVVQKHLKDILTSKELLLVPGQHLQFPPSHLDDSTTTRLHSLADFLKRTDHACTEDLQRCASKHSELSDSQWCDVQKTGRLTVPSELLHDQEHVWQVHPAFYSGGDTIIDSWCEGTGAALDHVVVAMQESCIGDAEKFWWSHPSLSVALARGLKDGLLTANRAIQQPWWPCHWRYSRDAIERRLLVEAEKSYCQARLEEEFSLGDLGVTPCLHRDTSTTEREWLQVWEVLEDTCPEFAASYRPSTSQFQKRRRTVESLSHLREDFDETRTTRGQALDYSELHKSPKTALQEKGRADKAWDELQHQEWIDFLTQQDDEETRHVAQQEADRLLALEVEEEIRRQDSDLVEEELANYENELKKRRPILFLSKAWRSRKLGARRHMLEAELEQNLSERVSKQLEAKGLQLQSRVRMLAAEFRSSVAPGLLGRLLSKKHAYKPATFRVLQLNPNNWSCDPEHGYDKYQIVKVDLDRPFWRFWYTWTWFVQLTKGLVGSAFHFLTAGPLSLRALVSRRAYYAIELPVREPTSYTSTWISRLKSFFEELAQVRERFESEPDTGLIGKSVQRQFLRFRLAVKAVVGTLAISAFMLIGTGLSTAVCSTVTVAAPVLAGGITLLATLFNAAVYDIAIGAARYRREDPLRLRHPETEPSAVSPLIKVGFIVPYKMLIRGVLQAVLATLRLAVVHPLVGSTHFAWATIRLSLRSLRDSLTWKILRRYAHTPATDSFLAWRIHGPGLAATQYYRLPIEGTKASVLLYLDQFRLAAHDELRRAELEAPYVSYRSLFADEVEPFGVGVRMKERPPSAVAQTVCYGARAGQPFNRQNRDQTLEDWDRPEIHEGGLDVWDSVANRIRSADPNFTETQSHHESSRWLNQYGQMTTPLSASDEMIRSRVAEVFDKYKLSGDTALTDIVNRAAFVMAEWDLQRDVREQRLTAAVSIPPFARGRFRMSHEEQQDLWLFTLKAVEVYGDSLREELEQIAAGSAFSESLKSTVQDVIESFYTKSGARPGVQADLPLLAAFVLRELLGGEDVLDTLEDTDKALILSRTLSPEDEHLIFWRSLLLE